MTTPSPLTIAADIGGTHARFAVVKDGNLFHAEKKEAAPFATLADALASYCRTHDLPAKGTLLIAAAAQPGDDCIWRFLNGNRWIIDRKALTESGWDVALLINDFAASARGAVTLTADNLVTLKDGGLSVDAGLPRVILGPGTGLGMAFLTPLPNKRWHIQETFGGHMLATAQTDEQFAIMKDVAALHGSDHALVPEDLISGRGLPFLYRAVCERDGARALYTGSDEILAHAATDAHVCITLRLFHEFLGLFAQNAAVTGHAFGGIYLDGGLIQRLYAAKLFDGKTFARFFIPAVVPVVRQALESTPVWLVRDPFVALKGLAALHQK